MQMKKEQSAEKTKMMMMMKQWNEEEGEEVEMIVEHYCRFLLDVVLASSFHLTPMIDDDENY
jgi:hypothetical protein